MKTNYKLASLFALMVVTAEIRAADNHPIYVGIIDARALISVMKRDHPDQAVAIRELNTRIKAYAKEKKIGLILQRDRVHCASPKHDITNTFLNNQSPNIENLSAVVELKGGAPQRCLDPPVSLVLKDAVLLKPSDKPRLENSFAFINMEFLMKESVAAKDYSLKLENELKPKEIELQKKAESAKSISKDDPSYNMILAQLKEEQQAFRTALNTRRQYYVTEFLQKANEVIREKSEILGYSFILQDAVLVDDRFNKTEDFLKLINSELSK